MATKITDRAVKIAAGTIRNNNVPYAVYADTQVGQRVKSSQPNRYWLILTTEERQIVQSTQRQAVYAEWMELIAANGTPA